MRTGRIRRMGGDIRRSLASRSAAKVVRVGTVAPGPVLTAGPGIFSATAQGFGCPAARNEPALSYFHSSHALEFAGQKRGNHYEQGAALRFDDVHRLQAV